MYLLIFTFLKSGILSGSSPIEDNDWPAQHVTQDTLCDGPFYMSTCLGQQLPRSGILPGGDWKGVQKEISI